MCLSRKHHLMPLSVNCVRFTLSVLSTSVRWGSLGWHHSFSMSNQLHMCAGCIYMTTSTGQQAANQNSRKHFSYVPELEGREGGEICRKEFSWQRVERGWRGVTFQSIIEHHWARVQTKSNTNRTKVNITHRTIAHDQDVLSTAVAYKSKYTLQINCKQVLNDKEMLLEQVVTWAISWQQGTY